MLFNIRAKSLSGYLNRLETRESTATQQSWQKKSICPCKAPYLRDLPKKNTAIFRDLNENFSKNGENAIFVVICCCSVCCCLELTAWATFWQSDPPPVGPKSCDPLVLKIKIRLWQTIKGLSTPTSTKHPQVSKSTVASEHDPSMNREFVSIYCIVTLRRVLVPLKRCIRFRSEKELPLKGVSTQFSVSVKTVT